MRIKHEQDGFHVLPVAVLIIVVAVIGIVGIKLNKANNKQPSNNQPVTDKKQSASEPVIWDYNHNSNQWIIKSGNAPKCKEPFKLDITPIDISKVIAVGLPGAYRGFSYKAHGGFRLANSTKGQIEVKLPIDANFRGVTRYYEAVPGQPDELQYMLDFENDCGIAYRFDHIHTLTPAMQAYADKAPPPKKDDTRSDPNAERISVPMKSGEVIATAVGFLKAKNYGFDFGVYDYRKRNEISKNDKWADIHRQFSASTFHGVCWLHMLPGDDSSKAIAMAKDRNNYNASKPFNLTSDYCDFAPHNTLDFNNGQPTDG